MRRWTANYGHRPNATVNKDSDTVGAIVRPVKEARVRDNPPLGVDTSRPNIARVYDYLLGGKDNFGRGGATVDRRRDRAAARSWALRRCGAGVKT